MPNTQLAHLSRLFFEQRACLLHRLLDPNLFGPNLLGEDLCVIDSESVLLGHRNAEVLVVVTLEQIKSTRRKIAAGLLAVEVGWQVTLPDMAFRLLETAALLLASGKRTSLGG